MLNVACRATGETVFRQDLGEWFYAGLVARTLWKAAGSGLGGKRVVAEIELAAIDGHVAGWQVTLYEGNRALFACQFPTTRLCRGTALAVAEQCGPLVPDGRVIYWVSAREMPLGKPEQVEIGFDESEDASVVVPTLPVRRASAGTVLVEATGWPTEVVLELSHEASVALLGPIEAGRRDVELAWAGLPEVYRTPRGELVFRIAQLGRLASPNASATLVPISADELLNAVGVVDRPLVVIHTHVSVHEDALHQQRARLQCSYEDLVSVHRLAVGSLFVIASGSPPPQLRVYGWPLDGGEVRELNTIVTVCQSADTKTLL
jgi:hypothetical protein